MITLFEQSTQFPVPDDQDLSIVEHVGKINTKTQEVSIARLKSGQGWSEPAQTPLFDEYSLVLSGELHIESVEDGKTTIVRANQAVLVSKGTKIQYSTPSPEGADYISVCLPAFDMELAQRES